jgi:hypothetical protein
LIAPLTMAQECERPTETMVAPEEMVETWTGIWLSMVEELPSWPLVLLPQHQTVPLERTAQVWVLPAETVVQLQQLVVEYSQVELLQVRVPPG